jgi:hypothetical protein
MIRNKQLALTETIINNLSKETLDLDGLTSDFYHTSKEEIIPILYNLFQKMEAEKMLPKIL